MAKKYCSGDLSICNIERSFKHTKSLDFDSLMGLMITSLILLTISALIWGFGFIAARLCFETFDPYWSHALRFFIAAIFGIPFLIYKKSFAKNMSLWKDGFVAAFFLTGTLLLQTIGIKYTTIAKSGFITTLYSFFVPLTMMVFFQKKYSSKFWFLVILALIGMALLCNLEVADLNFGDFLMLLCSLFASFHIIFIGKVASKIESGIEFNFIQNLFMAVWAFPIVFFSNWPKDFSPLLNINSNAFKGIIFLSLFSSVLAFSIQVITQKKIPSHLAGLIFLLESPFAAIFAYFILDERLNLMNIVGAGFIVLSVALVPFFGREVSASLKQKGPQI